MSLWTRIRRHRTLMLGFVALGVFVYGAVVVFGVDPQFMLDITLGSLLLVALMAALGFLLAWVLHRFRK